MTQRHTSKPETSNSKKPKENGDILTGRFFHTFLNDGSQRKVIQYQGQVLGKVNDSHYLVQLFSFLDGRPTTQHVFCVSEMTSWVFYASDAEMREAYERG